jgi:hypothetical protein
MRGRNHLVEPDFEEIMHNIYKDFLKKKETGLWNLEYKRPLLFLYRSQLLWNWTAKNIAAILGKPTSLIPQEWLLRQRCAIQPRSRKRAVLWLLAQLIVFRQKCTGPTSLHHYMGHVRRAWRALQAQDNCHKSVATLLGLVDDHPLTVRRTAW